MNSPLLGVIIRAHSELPSLMKAKLFTINVGDVTESVDLGCFIEINYVSMFIVVLISEVLDGPCTKSAEAYEKVI